AVKGKQAGREYYVSMVPLKILSKLFITDTDTVSPEFRAQRRLNEARIPAIRDYILDNRETYVFSALSASIDGKYDFCPYDKDGDIGILEVDMNTIFLVNDGQHRKAAIEEALKEDRTLGDETISVVFFEDKGLERSQQMFTDLNKHAVKTSNSISTLYDSRDELAVVTKEVIAQIPFFNQYTDKEKDNLGKNSSKLITLNNIYKANRKIIKQGVTKSDGKFLLEFWCNIEENIIEWQELMNKQISKMDLRQNYVLCLNVTILAFGILGAYYYTNPDINMSESLKKLKKINWSRDNLDDWGGRVIGDFGKVLSSENAVTLICNKIKQLLDIPLSKEEQIKEDKLKSNKK
ncbi:MAG: DNA sulfur modification protein DndB, partial [Ruminococcus sp.]|nr:DNA sulfur modification protein DndB [Ruminococcus sp.]